MRVYIDIRKLNRLGADEKSPVLRKLFSTPPFMNSPTARGSFLNGLSDLAPRFKKSN